MTKDGGDAFAGDLAALDERLARQRDREGWVPSALLPCAWAVHAEMLDDEAAVRARWRAFAAQGPAAGWVQTTSSVRMIREGEGLPEDAPLLDAELAGADASLHVRHVDGRWCVARIDEGPARPDAPSAGIWCREVRHASADPAARAFVYRVACRVTENGALETLGARLARVEFGIDRGERP